MTPVDAEERSVPVREAADQHVTLVVEAAKVGVELAV